MTYINKPEIMFDPSNMSAFGTLETAELTPVIQGDFVYGLNTQIWSTAVVSGTGATVDTDASRLRIQSGTNAAGYAYVTTRRPVRYRAGQGTVARFTPIFGAGVAANTQLWGMGTIVSNVPYDGYFFGYNGDAFSIAHYNAGTPAWTAQTSWNGDKIDGTAGTSFTLDPTKGTPAMIKYPYLGYGDIEFFFQNPTTGRWVLVHTIRYANSSAAVQLTNPNLYFLGFNGNGGNTNNKIMYCGSVGIFVSGARSFAPSPRWAMNRNTTGVTSEVALLTLRNATTYNGMTNRGLIRLNALSVSNSANATITIRLLINTTLGGSPSYTTINGTTADGGVTITSGNSIASYDVAGTTVTGGTYVFNLNVGPTGSEVIDLTQFDLFVAPGETLTFAGASTASSTIGLSVNWSEDI